MARATGEHARALAGCIGNVLLDLGERFGVDQRPLNDTLVDAVSDLQFCNFRGKP